MSVTKALSALQIENIVTRDRQTILSADRVILPGVGAFADAMKKLNDYDLVDIIHDVVEKKIPLLGICLGLQLLFEESEESPGVKGLGILPGKIKRIPDAPGLKIPHIGWNSLDYPHGKRGRIFEDVDEGSFVYFVHSYYLESDDQSIVTATADYGVRIQASVEKDNIFACQFHPEKSSRVGARILSAFSKI